MTSDIITFIGGGNMASSLVGGLLAGGHPASAIRVADPDRTRLQAAASEHGVATFESNAEAINGCDVMVLAIKPQVASSVVRELASAAALARPLVMSVVAGLRSADIARWLGFPAAIVRTMPNTPALLGVGAAGLFGNDESTQHQRAVAEYIMNAVGLAVWVEEEPLLDAVTGLSGSGPAYYFLLMEMMARAGETMGLDAETSRRLTLQTALGAARMALESGDDPRTLRRKVTSPGGTTERGINSLLDNGFEQQVLDAVAAARDRAVELADLIAKE
jgi:pyrroline-5-carboxylate reductase